MKKIIPTLIFLSLLAVIFSPILVGAQEKVPDCCKLSRDIELDEVTYNKGIWVGEKNCEGKITADCLATGTASTDCASKKWGLLCLLSSIYVITDWIFTFLMALVGVMVILGAFTLTTAAGSPEKIKKGKDYILYAAIGLLVALLAKAVPALIKSLLG